MCGAVRRLEEAKFNYKKVKIPQLVLLDIFLPNEKWIRIY